LDWREKARDRKVIAVHLEPTELSSGMQLSLGNRQAVLRHGLTEDAYREKLRAALSDAPARAEAERVLPIKMPDRLRWAFVAGIAALITAALWLVRPLPQDDLNGAALLILPFENLSPEETNAYFAAGLHEDLLTGLSRIPDLVVISKTTAKHLASSSLSLAEMAAEVEATHVLEGSARRDEQRVRISVTLVDAAKDRQVWSNSYDVELHEVIATQTALAQQIANQLRLRLDDDLLARFAQAPTTNLDAYDLYLRALSLRGSVDVSDWQKSIALLEEAVALDPDYSEAWARLGSLRDTLKRVQRLPWAEYRDEVMEPLRRAYAIDR
jgi:TolB-like protein